MAQQPWLKGIVFTKTYTFYVHLSSVSLKAQLALQSLIEEIRMYKVKLFIKNMLSNNQNWALKGAFASNVFNKR